MSRSESGCHRTTVHKHAHTYAHVVLHTSHYSPLTLLLPDMMRPPPLLHFFPFSFPSPETLRWTVNSVEFQRGEGLMLLDEADWVNLSTWWTFCGLGSCCPADCRLPGWHRLFRHFFRRVEKETRFSGQWVTEWNDLQDQTLIWPFWIWMIVKCIYTSIHLLLASTALYMHQEPLQTLENKPCMC